MSNKINLKELEKKVFRSTFQDGLLDIWMGFFMLQFVIPVYLKLGDFWSSFVLLPFYLILLLLYIAAKKYITKPRIGMVKYSSARKTKIHKITIFLLVLLLLGLITGSLFFDLWRKIPNNRWLAPSFFSVLMLSFFSVGAYFLDLPRFYVFGIFIFISIPIGEILFWNGYVSHHGYPIVFSIAAGMMIINGTILFIRFLREYPLPDKNSQLGED